jgi:hypothetical protein
MERTKWTDDLLDQRIAAMDEKSDRQFDELRTLRAEMQAMRAEMHARFSELRAEMHAGFSELRAEMHAGFSELRAQIVALHRQQSFILTGSAVGLLGLLGAQLF